MKKFSPTDIVMMKMQEIGKDKFLLGVQYHEETLGVIIDRLIDSLKEFKETHKEDLSSKTEFGFRAGLEIFEKREEAKDKF